ncbi:MAG: hypothetical protein V7L26_13330 [Nostoc sp.]|uniref:hypothetical protein n=1 Tax=Nostoc sp. TaxID=1180 RepID=UPI002FF3D0E4
MPRWSAQEKQAYRTEVIQRITAAMPLVMQEYASIKLIGKRNSKATIPTMNITLTTSTLPFMGQRIPTLTLSRV